MRSQLNNKSGKKCVPPLGFEPWSLCQCATNDLFKTRLVILTINRFCSCQSSIEIHKKVNNTETIFSKAQTDGKNFVISILSTQTQADSCFRSRHIQSVGSSSFTPFTNSDFNKKNYVFT